MMWAAAILLAYGVILGTGGALALRSAHWPDLAPRLGIAAWQVLSASALAALFLAGAVMLNLASASPTDLSALAWVVRMFVHGQLPLGGAAMWCLAAMLLAIFLAMRIGYSLLAAFLQIHRARASHDARLRLLAHREDGVDALIVDHPVAAAYCVPGREPRVVLTSAALAALDPPELAAVLAHERAHLNGRHHLVLAVSGGLRSSLPFIPLFRWAHQEQARLLEMLADDAAVAVASRITVACAMVRMAEGPVPVAALGAGNVDTLARVQRLLDPNRPMSRMRGFGIGLLLVATAMVPFVVAAIPAAATKSTHNACANTTSVTA